MPTCLYTNCTPSCYLFDNLHLPTPWDETSSIHNSFAAYITTWPEAVLRAELMVDRQLELAQLFSDTPRLRSLKHLQSLFSIFREHDLCRWALLEAVLNSIVQKFQLRPPI